MLNLKQLITYLKTNKIKYFKFFNIIITIPTTSPQFDQLCYIQTKIIQLKHKQILITKF